MPKALLKAYGIVKYCAATVNLQQQRFDPEIAKAIQTAAKQLADGELLDQFPLSIWQSGSGTQTNMNVNEVLARVASDSLAQAKQVHPNDHCNCSQSTNDSFPTALHIACTELIQAELLSALEALTASFKQKQAKWTSLLKTGRTHLQDATPISLAQEFSAYAAQLDYAMASLQSCMPAIQTLTMGGTAVGTGMNTIAGFADAFATEASKITGYDFVPSANCFATQAAHDAIVQLSGCLNTLAVALNKIASDLRLLASGPRCGLAEITLPANEPGSSIMPGKINPSQCEMMNMVCAQVMGNHTTITIAGAQGQLELNTFKPVIAYNILQSLNLLADAINSFDQYCIQGIEANEPLLKATVERSLMLVTALSPYIGYDKAAELALRAKNNQTTLRQEAIQSGLVTAQQFDRWVQLETMLSPKPKQDPI